MIHMDDAIKAVMNRRDIRYLFKMVLVGGSPAEGEMCKPMPSLRMNKMQIWGEMVTVIVTVGRK